MTDIIIRNPDALPAERCIELVRRVIMKGLTSTHRGMPCYCLLTVFPGYREQRVHAHRTDTAQVFRVEVCGND